MLGEAPIVGVSGDRGELGFLSEKGLSRGRRNPRPGFVLKLLYGTGASLVTQSSKEGSPATRRRRARRRAVLHAFEEDEDDPSPLFFLDEGVCGWPVGLWLGPGCWAAVGLLGQVRSR